jgi:hypothetical protein
MDRKKAIEKLWRMGNLDWMLKPNQTKIKEAILTDSNKVSVVVCARRSGKSFLLLTMAIEECIRKPNTIVKFLFPHQKDAKTNIRPLMRDIIDQIEDPDAACPNDVKPVWKEQDKMYEFPNGSVIQMAGSDGGAVESIRGGKSSLCIVDEAGFVSDLTYAVRSVLSPTVKTTRGRIIMASTPSKHANHEFVTNYMLPYLAEGRTKIFTIYDNPNFDEEMVKETISEYPGGVDNLDFKREYLCQIPNITEKSILPSLSEDAINDMVQEVERPKFFDSYVSMDLGFKDLTVVLFGYYDYLNARTVIEDEIVLEKMNTQTLADSIKAKEESLWVDEIDGSPKDPYMRVSDNNLIVINDLWKLHNIYFIPTKKDKRDAAINALDIDIANRSIVINPRCKTLLYHMRFAEWNTTLTDFKRLKDSPSGEIKGGHADGLAALVYFHRNVQKQKNPYPLGYNLPTGENVFYSRGQKERESSNVVQFNKFFSKALKKAK